DNDVVEATGSSSRAAPAPAPESRVSTRPRAGSGKVGGEHRSDQGDDMAARPMNEVLEHLRRAASPGAEAGQTDRQLLEGFLSRREEAALAALVRRHGPMVWGVCRRVLGDHHDAEDAFQATFLVLVRKAGSIASRELLAGWLHGVARQTALKARATAARRR